MIKFEPAVTRSGRDVRLAAVRHGWSHVLRSLSIAASLTDGDFVRGVILLAILNANTTEIRSSKGDQDYDTGKRVPGDSLRTPVSVYAIAKQLALPYETVRRHVARLVEDGRCEKAGARGGIIVPASAILQMRPEALLRESLESLQVLIGDLDRIGALHHQAFHDSESSSMIG